MTSSGERVSAVYVWAMLGGAPVIAGRFERRDGVGVFYYANSYIERPGSYALDPINLPLIAQREFHTRANDGYFGVLLDAGPDHWGQRVLAQLSPSRPRNPLEFLLAGNGDGCGALLFSLSRSVAKRPGLRGESVDLALLESAAQDLLQQGDIPEQLRSIMLESVSLGGARPKVAATIGGEHYLAKFTKTSDIFNEVIAEQTSLDMARALGIDVPDHRLMRMPINARHAILIKRFDYAGEPGAGYTKRHYLSAHAVLNLHRVRESSPACGYPQLAALARRFCDGPQQISREIFRRLAFRMLIGDTDDHGRNHGFIYDEKSAKWVLAPMFDVLPHPRNIEQQAMAFGSDGRQRSLKNLLSMSDAYALLRHDAHDIISEILAVVVQWREYAERAGMSKADMSIIAPSFALAESIAR